MTTLARILAAVALVLGASCHTTPDPDRLFGDAVTDATAGRRAESLDALRRALEAGYASPSTVLSDPRTRGLLDHAPTRAKLHELLQAHAREASITMVRSDEPGTKMVANLTIVDERSGEPVASARVELVHVDATGHYMQDDTKWNPRLFGFARTDASGQAVFRTIRPVHYAAGDSDPAHFHFNIERDGYRPYGGEIVFADDPRLVGEARTEVDSNRTPIAQVHTNTDGSQACDAVIRLQPR